MSKEVQKVESPAELDKIGEITSGILGELCWEARLGYGDELKLEIGAKEHNGVREHGVWNLGSRGTDWKLVAQDGTLITEDCGPDYAPDEIREQIIQKIQTIVNRRVTAFEAIYPSLGLTVTFDNGSQLMILPAPEDDEWEVSYWELFTPDGVLEVGPGATWSFVSESDRV